MIHKNCGGEIVKEDVDTYRCKKCKRGWKCVGREEYLKDVLQ